MKAKKRASTLKFEDKNENRMKGDDNPQSHVLGQDKSASQSANKPPDPQPGPPPSEVPLASDLEQDGAGKEEDENSPRFEDFSKYKDLAMREQYPFMTPEYREWAESTASEVDFDDLFSGEVRQTIRLNRKSSVTMEFRTLVQEDMMDLQEQAGSPYLTDTEPNLKYYAYQLCLAIYRFGGTTLPPFRDKLGKWDEELFNRRLRVLNDLPYMTMQFVDVHRRWFMERIGKMFGEEKAEQLKNG